jgi:VWFA-related protein
MTALYDAIGVYLHGAAAQDGRKIMLVYTDGGDTRSSIRFGELIDLLKTTDATVYAIGALGHQSSSARGPQRAVLEQIADATAGRAFFPTSHDDLDRAYAQIVSEIRAQYLLGYESTNGTADGSWRKVEVRVGKKDDRRYRVRARRGYFAPYRKPSP